MVYTHEIAMTAIGVLTTGILYWIKDIVKKHKNDHKDIKATLKSHDYHFMLSYKRELQKDFQYFKRNGKITMYEKTIWLEMYDDYVSRGGNSFIEDIKEELCDLLVED